MIFSDPLWFAWNDWDLKIRTAFVKVKVLHDQLFTMK